MVQKKTFNSPLNSFQRLSVRKDGIKIRIWELLLLALMLTLASCGGGSPAHSPVSETQLSPEEIQRRNEEEERKRREAAEAAKRQRAEEERRRQEQEAARKEQAEREEQEKIQRYEELKKAPLELSRKPSTSKRSSTKEVSKFELRTAAKAANSYYVKGRKKSKGLLDIKDAQVIFVGNTHMLPDAQSVIEKMASEKVKETLNQSRDARILENETLLESKDFSENVLLVEGTSFNDKVELSQLEDFRIVEKELVKGLNIQTIRGWDNSYANHFASNMIETLRQQNLGSNNYSYFTKRDQTIIELYILQISFDFLVIQLRNYFLYQSIVRALEENPKARIIVTAGTCHTACDESLFSLMDSTNIRYATYESKSSVEVIANIDDPKEMLLSQLDSYRYDKRKIPEMARKVRQLQLNGFIDIALKYQDQIAQSKLSEEAAITLNKSLQEITELKEHLKEFFSLEAYTD